MKKISFLFIIIILSIACETNDEQSNNDYYYGKLLSNNNKQLIKIMLNDILFFEFDYDSLNRLSELSIFNADSIMQNEKYLYNSNNQVVERKYGNISEYFNYKNGSLTERYSINGNNSEWKPKTIYNYDSDEKIFKADQYFNNILIGYIEYDYDNKGNTISRREYSQNDNETYLSSEFRCNYDDKINPLKLINYYPVDILQKNNIIYSYTYSIYMSRMPPEYNSTFVYDNDGFPIEEQRFYKWSSTESNPLIYTYIYNK